MGRSRRRTVALLVLAGVALGAPVAAARDGAPDSGFGTAGLKRFSLEPGTGSDGASGLVLLPKGRIANAGGNGFGLSLHRRFRAR